MSNTKTRAGMLVTGLGLTLAPALAAAHTGASHAEGLLAGLVHPLTGWDHLAAALAVGVWLGQMRGRPVRAMAPGFVLALAANPAPAWALPCILLVGAAHGMAHGAEMPATTAAVVYVTGFAAVSSMILVAGWTLARVPALPGAPGPRRLVQGSGALLAFASGGLALA